MKKTKLKSKIKSNVSLQPDLPSQEKLRSKSESQLKLRSSLKQSKTTILSTPSTTKSSHPVDKYSKVKWSKHELIYVKRDENRKKYLNDRPVSFTSGLRVKLRVTPYGIFLTEFNSQQHQDRMLNENKLEILNYELHQNCLEDWKIFNRQNDIFEDYLQFLRNEVYHRGKINIRNLEQKLTNLRVNNVFITHLDIGISRFKLLQVLVLNGNYIVDLIGSMLPDSIKFLGVYCNKIRSVENLTDNPPRCMVHFNIGRNCLDENNSHLNLMASHKNFRDLTSLDLSDNDLYHLKIVLSQLKPLEALRVLFLEGNPCSLVMSYKDAVLDTFPYLKYLDGTAILKADRKLHEEVDFEQFINDAQMEIYIYRIINLPKPPKEKGVKHQFHVEFSIPLLEPAHSEDEEVEEEEEDPIIPPPETPNQHSSPAPPPPTAVSPTRTKKSGKGSKKGKSDASELKLHKSASKASKHGIFDTPIRDKSATSVHIEEKPSFKYRSEPFEHSKFLTLRPIYITPGKHNLKALRDTFRSKVNVKIVYRKMRVVKKAKKAKKQKSDKSSTTSNLLTRSVKSSSQICLQKLVVGSFNCHLHSINWSDKTIDFYWAEHPHFRQQSAIEIEGALELLNYNQGKPKKKKSPSTESVKLYNLNDLGINESDLKKIKVPKIFTVQLGFGVTRK